MPVGAAIGGGSALSGLLGYFGARRAGDQQAEGQRQALEMFRPYADMGRGAMTTLASLYGIGGAGGGQPFNPSSLAAFRSSPGYEFARGEGMRAVDFGDSARGQLISSNNLRGRQEMGTNLADRTFMGSYVQPLLSLAGIGAGGAQGAAGAMTGAANAQAGGTVGGFNALAGGVGGAGNNLMLYNLLNNQNRSSYGAPRGAPSDYFGSGSMGSAG